MPAWVVVQFGWADIPVCLELRQTGMSAPPNCTTTPACSRLQQLEHGAKIAGFRASLFSGRCCTMLAAQWFPAVVFVWLLSLASSRAAAQQPPNFVIIFADDQG